MKRRDITPVPGDNTGYSDVSELDKGVNCSNAYLLRHMINAEVEGSVALDLGEHGPMGDLGSCKPLLFKGCIDSAALPLGPAVDDNLFFFVIEYSDTLRSFRGYVP